MAQPIISLKKSELELATKGNMGGSTRKIGIIRADAVAEIPAADENTNTISSAITFVDDTLEVFSMIEITKNSGDVRHELQGEIDGKSYHNFIDFNLPTGLDKVLTLCKQLANEDVIAVAQDKRGNWRVLGTLDLPATLNQATGQLGKAAADANNTAFILEADWLAPAPILTVTPQFEVTAA
ncbi:hypothetical protein [Chondrinema litorale]|uniref:hypothetical protein n=1 Tax=Chondrinema litorale TaxID=2994555 RepID=UPI0025429924|nr:hypothetical protein [Chondrinema litorale]UZR93154.1 hypothetical protein OQ292_14940 [Chondrinema litorale]